MLSEKIDSLRCILNLELYTRLTSKGGGAGQGCTVCVPSEKSEYTCTVYNVYIKQIPLCAYANEAFNYIGV